MALARVDGYILFSEAPADLEPLLDAHAGRVPALAASGVPVVYVSCNPATLARDAGLLEHQGGYRCTAAGAVNMFPHTAHVESIAVFERVRGGSEAVAA